MDFWWILRHRIHTHSILYLEILEIILLSLLVFIGETFYTFIDDENNLNATVVISSSEGNCLCSGANAIDTVRGMYLTSAYVSYSITEKNTFTSIQPWHGTMSQNIRFAIMVFLGLRILLLLLVLVLTRLVGSTSATPGTRQYTPNGIRHMDAG